MIQTNLHQIEQPDAIQNDSRGSKITIGSKCVFNKSGAVMFGIIKLVHRNEWKVTRPGVSLCQWWGLKFEIEIIDESGNMSKIKNPNSFVII